MIDVNRTVLERSTRVGQISANAAFEETLAAFASKHPIMLARRLVPTNPTVDVSNLWLAVRAER